MGWKKAESGFGSWICHLGYIVGIYQYCTEFYYITVWILMYLALSEYGVCLLDSISVSSVRLRFSRVYFCFLSSKEKRCNQMQRYIKQVILDKKIHIELVILHCPNGAFPY